MCIPSPKLIEEIYSLNLTTAKELITSVLIGGTVQNPTAGRSKLPDQGFWSMKLSHYSQCATFWHYDIRFYSEKGNF